MKCYTLDITILTEEEIRPLSFQDTENMLLKISEVLNLKEANFLNPAIKLEHESK